MTSRFPQGWDFIAKDQGADPSGSICPIVDLELGRKEISWTVKYSQISYSHKLARFDCVKFVEIR